MSQTDREQLLSRLQGAKTAEKVAPVTDDTEEDGEEYKAFNVVDRRKLSLHLRPVKDPYQWVKYSYLLHIQAAPSGRRLDLVYSFMLITITGRNLFEIARAIGEERCGYVKQFDAAIWQQPKDTSAPFVESIAFRMNNPVDLARGKEAA